MSRPDTLRVEYPDKLDPLLAPARYKGAHGGRGGAKSHFFAEQVVLQAYMHTKKIVCIREVQESIKDSVKALIEAKIEKLGLGGFFTILETEIRGLNGSLIIFKGMQSYNAENIKSLEGFDIAWVEEAQSLSEFSLRMLRPTLRKDGSELWFSWNPRHDTDAVDVLLRGPKRPSDAIVVEVNWQDNPWFPQVLRREMEQDYANDPEMAEHVWGGGYQLMSEAAYYARQIIQAEREGRIGEFPYNPTFAVSSSWDIGVADYTAIWITQTDGVTVTVLDYYEASGDGVDDVLSVFLPEIFIPPQYDRKFSAWRKDEAMQRLGRALPYKYAHHFLPHDVRVRDWAAGARTRAETLIGLGVRNIVKGVPRQPADRIQAVRRVLPICRFNHTPRVEQGLKRLRRYHRKFNDSLQTYTTPEHDENSHGADAFGEFAINCPINAPKPPTPPKDINTSLGSLDEAVAHTFKNRKHFGDRI